MNIQIYTTQYCPYCSKAKALLTSLGLTYQEIDVEHDQKLREEMIQKTGHMTVPIILIDDVFIGGYDDLAILHAKGELVK